MFNKYNTNRTKMFKKLKSLLLITILMFTGLYAIEPDIFVSPDSLEFPKTKINNSDTLQFTIYNQGVDSTLEVSGISSATASFTPLQSTASILPGDSVIIDVEFTPQNMGEISDSLIIRQTEQLLRAV